jgi:hypothetical protein
MKRVLTALAVVGITIFALAGCNDYGNTFQANTGAQITTLSPRQITAGSPSFTLTITGSGFVPQTYITWNNQRLPTLDITDSAGDVLQVYATIPASLVAKEGSALIVTHNPYSGAGNNGLSNPLNFMIDAVTQPNPVPLLQSISPTNATVGAVGAAGVTLMVAGSDFVTGSPGAVVCWTPPAQPPPAPAPIPVLLGVVTPPTPSATQTTVNIPQSLLMTAGTAAVTVLNPPYNSPPCGATGGGITSTSLAFTIVAPNPVPTLTSISPTSVSAGSPSFTLMVVGTNFITNLDPTQATMVNWMAGGTTTALPVLTSPAATTTQISVTVPASLVATAGSANVFVVNPPNRAATPPGGGGGKSSSQAFTIGPAPEVVKAQSAAEETPAVSADGRYVAYTAMQGQYAAIFFRDTCAGAGTICLPKTFLVSESSDGDGANDESHSPSISADGRYVAFASSATNLLSPTKASSELAAVSGPGRQVYLRDTCTGAASGCVPSTQLVSTDPSGQLVGTESILPSVSASGRFVAFVAVTQSKSPAGGTTANNNSASSGGYRQVFVRDTCLGAASCTPKTTRISLQPGDGTESDPAAATPAGPALSGDAKKIALTGGGTAVLFMQSVAVDDRLFVAALGQSR